MMLICIISIDIRKIILMLTVGLSTSESRRTLIGEYASRDKRLVLIKGPKAIE